MEQTIDSELRTILDQMRSDLAKLAARLERLENGAPAIVQAQPANGHAPEPAVEPAAEEGISEEIVLAISAAIAAYLGERVHIRQIRLISSSAWAQVGRASVQASHQVH
jgi:methylmalonyl-CoA carboxyltransferase large subunit